MRYAHFFVVLLSFALGAESLHALELPYSSGKTFTLQTAMNDDGDITAVPVSCDESCCNTCCGTCCRGRVFFSMQYLYWQANQDAMPYAGSLYRPTGSIQGRTLAGSSMISELQNANFDINSGFRVGIGYRMSDYWDIGFRYTYFNTNGAASIGDSTVDSNSVLANRLDRSLANDVLNYDFDDGVVDYASQSLSLTLNVYDIEFRRQLRIDSRRLAVSVMGGFRFAKINQTSAISYQNLEGEVLMTADTDEAVDMTAAGLTFGGEAHYLVGGNFSIFARGGASLLFADFGVSRTDLQLDATDAGLRSVSEDFQNVVPTLELSAGLRWQYGRFHAAAGYEMSNWFNMAHGIEARLQDDVDGSTNSYDIARGDLSFHGLFAEAGWMF